MERIENTAALILAAGKGTRMRSQKPKVLHTLLGEPMLACVLAAAGPLFGKHLYVVSGHRAEAVEAAFPDCTFIRQSEQRGTGDALRVALPALAGLEAVLVLNGDAPLITERDIEEFLGQAAGAAIAFATICLPDAGAYGRVVRRPEGLAIVEAKDFDPALHGEPTGEVNSGMYLINLETAATLLPKIGNDNKSGEYYLTDLVGLGVEAGLDVRAIRLGADRNLLGVNSAPELAEAENIMAGRIAARLLDSGVILHGPQFLRAGPFVEIAAGAEIDCPCEILGRTKIAAGAHVGPYCVIRDSEISAGAEIRPFSHLDGAKVGANALVGPYTRLRPGAELEEDAHAGNFVELKKARLGRGAKANHLTYLGDADIGAGANIGAGTITCNYDGRNKFRTGIGQGAFIGSNSALVAPVEIGAGALVGAGSVITKDVPAGELAIARGRQKNLPLRKK